MVMSGGCSGGMDPEDDQERKLNDEMVTFLKKRSVGEPLQLDVTPKWNVPPPKRRSTPSRETRGIWCQPRRSPDQKASPTKALLCELSF
ncbi:unnamed protein product [Leptidea sinapis]|uniref:Uncharacterized protein n=1 Tax=Leptidea sinapis TaxID=189913 RepID=A0A5E4R4J0_9NEOP|nr:unnamed protein product [Leptidea sinapis]